VLFAGWSLYLLFVYPAHRIGQIRAEHAGDRANCYRAAYASTSPANFSRSDCISWTTKEEETDLDQWALGHWNYYRWQWPMLAVSIVLLPIILYGLVWRFARLLLWVREGFTSPFRLRSALARSFLIGAVGWTVFCTFVVPMVAAEELTKHYRASVAYCFDSFLPGTGIGGDSTGGDSYGSDLKECLVNARAHLSLGLNSGFAGFADFGMGWNDGDWGSFSGYFRHLGWLLIPIIAIPPLLTYALVGCIGVVVLWVWRGFGRPPSAKTAIILGRSPRQ